MLDAVGANVFVADPSLTLVYMNAKAAETMRGIGGEVEQAFRVQLADVLGGSIHRFHKDPARIERILHSPSFRPHRAEFTFGNVTLEAEINRVTTADGTLLGYVVAWQDVSGRIAAARRAASFAERLDEVQQVSVAVQAVASATEEMVASIQEIARNPREPRIARVWGKWRSWGALDLHLPHTRRVTPARAERWDNWATLSVGPDTMRGWTSSPMSTCSGGPA